MQIISIIAQTYITGDRSVTRKRYIKGEQIDRRRLVAYRDCGLSSRDIGQILGRKQATVLRICHRWMQEERKDRWGRSHPPRCITACDDGWIVRLAVMDPATPLRTIAQHIQSVTHHSVATDTI
ncbi:transposable element Tcb1 transposase [Trichonephila clavipes]|nr:transposable element Tcb1 transposase [Trichonephila clavipes]